MGQFQTTRYVCCYLRRTNTGHSAVHPKRSIRSRPILGTKTGRSRLREAETSAPATGQNLCAESLEGGHSSFCFAADSVYPQARRLNFPFGKKTHGDGSRTRSAGRRVLRAAAWRTGRRAGRGAPAPGRSEAQHALQPGRGARSRGMVGGPGPGWCASPARPGEIPELFRRRRSS
jgi:hypothetical protein